MSQRPDDAHRELSDAEAEELTRYLAGTLTEEAGRGFERRALADPTLAEALYVQTGIEEWARASLAEARVAEGERERRARRGQLVEGRFPWFRRRPWLLAAAVLAAAVGLATILDQARRPGGERLRSGAVSIRLLDPVGDLSEPPHAYRWTRAAGAVNYRFEFTNEETALRFVALVSDTTIDLATWPGAPSPPSRGTWKVVPLDANGADLPGPPPAAFRVR